MAKTTLEKIMCRKYMLSLYFFLNITYLAAQNYYSNPESVVFDSMNNRYLISNVGSGNIVQIDSIGNTKFFYKGLRRTLGMVIVDKYLFVAAQSGVVCFDLITNEYLYTILVRSQNVLNDITSDGKDNLYITDSGNGNIYRISISSRLASTIASGIHWPNGILFDEKNNRVLFCAFGNNVPIRAINILDNCISTIAETNLEDLDGITEDNEGNIYVSSWGSNSIYKFSSSFSAPHEIVSKGHKGPADIFYNKINNTLAVPNFNLNKVDFIAMGISSIEEKENNLPSGFSLSQNYPNPFNPITTIGYHIPEAVSVELSIINVLGQKIKTIVRCHQSAGEYKYQWDGTSENGGALPSAIYLYMITAGDYCQTKKMVLMK